MWSLLSVLLIGFGLIVSQYSGHWNGERAVLGTSSQSLIEGVEILEDVLPVEMIEPALAEHDGYTGVLDRPIRGLVVPHHALASELIADAVRKLPQSTRRIIVIGPNHQLHGAPVGLTTDGDLVSGWGRHSVDVVVVKRLEATGQVKIDTDYVRQEHGVLTVLPFVEHYFAEASVVPLVLHPGMSDQQLDTVATVLSEVMRSGDTVLVASVDFSHYLLPDQASEHDTVTANLITNWHTDQLRSLSSDYLDSPESIGLLMRVMEQVGATEVSVDGMHNSAEYTGEWTEPSTSYLVVEYH